MKPNEEALTAERLRELLSYEPETGEFRWRVGRGGTAVAGGRAGCKQTIGYRRIGVAGRMYWEHRLAWLYVNGTWPSDQIDHVNGVKGDNRIANLREATRSENQGNLRQARSDSKTGLLGVHWNKPNKKFMAQIMFSGKQKYLGLFSTAEQAHQAYLVAKRELHSHCTL